MNNLTNNSGQKIRNMQIN